MKIDKILFMVMAPLVALGQGPNAPFMERMALPTVEKARTMSVDQVAAASTIAGTTTGTTTTASKTQDVYVAIRKDGAVGAGTSANPYDGSTQGRFDAVIARVFAMGNANLPTVLHLAAGVYTITPVRQVSTTANPAGYVWNLSGNITIEGAGENSTTVRAGVVTVPNSTYYVFFYIGPYGGASFENLTIDCNMENQVLNGVTIDGVSSNNFGGSMVSEAEYVHVINGGNAPGRTGATEWFGITIHDYRTGADATITHCLVDHYQGSAGCTAVSATTNITNNVVTLNNNDPYGFAGKGGGGGYQNAYSGAFLVKSNTCSNCTFGIYSDVGSPTGFVIENNWFSCLYEGICFWNGSPDATLTNITIQNNVILKTYMQAITMGTGATTPVNTNLIITNNVLDSPDIPGSAQLDQEFAICAAADVTVTGNTISSSQHGNYPLPTAGSFTNSDLASFSWSDNKYSPAGGVMPPPAGVPQ